MFQFNRGISPAFVEKLNAEYERDGWWRNLASDPDLFIAIREGYLNVYWNGCSLLKLKLVEDRLVGEVHYKYLLRNDTPQPYLSVKDGVVGLDDAAALFHPAFPATADLKRSAAVYSGEEKEGVQAIILRNPHVVDAEITFGTGGNGTSPRRIDFAALRPTAAGGEIVFYEAKLFSNKAVRASGDGVPAVIGQIAEYGELLSRHAGDVAASYRAVCGNLAALHGVRDRYAASLDLLRAVASGEAALQIREGVWLVLFGFDSDQRDGQVWKPHKGKLLTSDVLNGRLILKGDPKAVNLKE